VLEEGRVLKLAAPQAYDNRSRDLQVELVEVADAVTRREGGLEHDHSLYDLVECRGRILLGGELGGSHVSGERSQLDIRRFAELAGRDGDEQGSFERKGRVGAGWPVCQGRSEAER